MAGRFERLQPHAPEFDTITVGKRREGVLCARGSTQIDTRARAVAQLEMPRDEVGVKVGQDHMFDIETVSGRERQVLINVALWIDDCGGACARVPDEI